MPSLFRRLLGGSVGADSRYDAGPIEPKRLFDPVPDSAMVAPSEEKANSLALLPGGAYGANYTFFSPDGGTTIIDTTNTSGQVILGFIAYWYIATRWRAQKISEAPLMVVEEDQESGADEWLPDHELVPVFDTPSPDYDMGELLEITSHYLDNTGSCLWVQDVDNVGRIARITPFSRNEFEPYRDATRMFATFKVYTIDGMKDFTADQVCFFRDAQHITTSVGTSYAPWGRGRSRLDIALSWLGLAQKAQQTIKDLLDNSVWPSAVMVPDKDWNPDPKTLAQYKQDLEAYARHGNRGKPFVALGGGKFTPLSTSIKDIVPTDILNRVESVIAAISGVPAIVLQYQIGLENAPWSHMAQARRMAYDDVISPTWTRIERVITRQLLRNIDDDPTHFVRFDRSGISSLEKDQLEEVQIASLMGNDATLNERRAVMGLEPASPEQDPNGKADEIPALTQPSMADIVAAAGSAGAPPPKGTVNNQDPAVSNGEPAPGQDSDKGLHGHSNSIEEKYVLASQDPAIQATRRKWIQRKFKTAVLQHLFRSEAQTTWEIHAQQRLKSDGDAIAQITSAYILDITAKAISSKSRGKDRAMSAIDDYLSTEGKSAWTKTMQPLMTKGAERSSAVIGADLNINYTLLHPNILKFAQQQTARMITQVNGTTKSLVSDIVQGGLDANQSTGQIATLIRDATGFDKARAKLIARTETTKIFNGAPTESLASLGQETGRTFTKTWSGVLDDKERDEHVEMEGETVGIDDSFSNGLDYPSEPNCRCTCLFDEVTE